jgi:hypothetical protein
MTESKEKNKKINEDKEKSKKIKESKEKNNKIKERQKHLCCSNKKKNSKNSN